MVSQAPNATLVLVRHGESTWIAEGRFQGRRDPPLSPLGERQAQLVAQRLAERATPTALPIPAGLPLGIWHSPLSRATATAQAIARAQPATVRVVSAPALTELAQGDWEGMAQAEVRSRWAAELAAWRRSPATSHAPGGESLADAAARVRAGIDEMLEDLSRAGVAAPPVEAGEDAAVLRHVPVPGYPGSAGESLPADPWAVLVAHDGVFRILLLTLLDLPLERFWSFPFSLCAITVVALHEGVPALRAHNLSEHLAPLAAEARAAAEARGDRRGPL